MQPIAPDIIEDVVAALAEAGARLTRVEDGALARADAFQQARQWIQAALVRLHRIETAGDSVEQSERVRYAYELALAARQEVERLLVSVATGEPLTFIGYAKYLLSRAQGVARELGSAGRPRAHDW